MSARTEIKVGFQVKGEIGVWACGNGYIYIRESGRGIDE